MPDLRIATAYRAPYCIEIADSYTRFSHMKALGMYIEQTGTTQTAFARRVGVKQPTISDLINGRRSASTKLLKRISMATGLSVDKLLADDAALCADEAPASSSSSHAA